MRAHRKKYNFNSDEIRELADIYKSNKKALSKMIYKAKEDSWLVLIATIEGDPWGPLQTRNGQA